MKPIKYDTYTFQEVWDNVEDFSDDYKASYFYDYTAATQSTPENYHNSLTNDNINKLFYLLYAKYGNSPIANFDVNQFKYKVYATIFQYGPNWQKELDIQDKLRNLSDTDLITGAKVIYNTAYHNGQAPATTELTETEYIDEQRTSNYKRTKLDAYNNLILLLKKDVTQEFLNKFKPLFKAFVSPEVFPIYISEDDDNE